MSEYRLLGDLISLAEKGEAGAQRELLSFERGAELDMERALLGDGRKVWPGCHGPQRWRRRLSGKVILTSESGIGTSEITPKKTRRRNKR